MSDELQRMKYIETQLVSEIVSKLENESLVSFKAERSDGLDGFMSAVYNIILTTDTSAGAKERLLLAKFMKGDDTFRETTKAYTMFANEIFVYAKVLPEYERIFKEANLDIRVDHLVPHCYVAKFGNIEGLSVSSTAREAVLVLEHLKPHGFELGPRLYLSRDQLFTMCATLGRYHALTYALREWEPAKLNELKSGIVPFPFVNENDPNDAQTNLYHFIYRAAFDRIFEYFDRKIVNSASEDESLIKAMHCLREKYSKEPCRVLEFLRTHVESNPDDSRFACILHGDYNRNNVLFRETLAQGDATPRSTVELRMIDFQELRYGSPALDLSFFMYMNASKEIREADWGNMLQEYHSNMWNTLASVLRGLCKGNPQKLEEVEKTLQNYSLEKFLDHFKRFAFYGVMICLHFLPWMLSSEEECARLAHLFETDMHGKEFHRLSVEAGGDPVNEELWHIVKQAFEMGHMAGVLVDP